MTCGSRIITPEQLKRAESALERLNKALGDNTVTLVIGASGSIAFKGWQDREGLSDLCAYRKLAATNSASLRRAIMRAEMVAGRRIDHGAVAAGMHSHDNGATWSKH
jgi:hypothetical protein